MGGPDGEYVSRCVAWFGEHNQIGYLEPVGTYPDFRRQGFGRLLVMEGIRRLAALGAEKAYVGSGQRFYGAIGFEERCTGYTWTKMLPGRNR